jgi:hypothetical protein
MCDAPSTAAFSVENLLNDLFVSFPHAFYSFSYDFSGPSGYWYDEAFHIPHLLLLLSRDSSFEALGYGLDDRGSGVRFPVKT